MATVVGMCLIWPTLEGLVSEAETPDALPRAVGIYNVVWAGTAALAYFTGGAMLDKLGLKSLFYVPVALFFLQLGLTLWLEGKARAMNHPKEPNPAPMPELNPRPIAKAKCFLRMAWLANPFAYIAINTLLAMSPGIAKRLGLSTTLAGFCCSV